jgi:hypothetical protein
MLLFLAVDDSTTVGTMNLLFLSLRKLRQHKVINEVIVVILHGRSFMLITVSLVQLLLMITVFAIAQNRLDFQGGFQFTCRYSSPQRLPLINKNVDISIQVRILVLGELKVANRRS